ncbi:MAG: SPOR domain-containing protein [Phycisphaerales bacterium]|nr:SPOR domain-containing protein [Phycisphaerales bacterium]
MEIVFPVSGVMCAILVWILDLSLRSASPCGRLCTVVGAGCLLLAGCAPRPSAQLHHASQAVTSQQSAAALEHADQAIRQARTADDRASAYYVRALARLQQGDRVGARADLQAGTHLHPDRALAARIEAQTANLDFEDGFYASAAARYAACADQLPRRPPTDRVLFQYGAALQRSGKFREGDETLRRLAKEYPASPLAEQASRKADWRATSFTVQCGAYRDEPSAQRRAAELRAKGFTARVVRAPQSATLPWVVHCGLFARYADAGRLLASLRTIQPDAFIVP